MRQIIPPGYTLLQELGRGRCGTVYHAQLEKSGGKPQSVALKIIDLPQIDRQKWNRWFENQLIAGLDHPQLIHIREMGWVDKQTPFITMPYISGGSLGQKLKSAPLPLAEAMTIISQVGETLTYAHEHQAHHLGLHPGNILLDIQGETIRPILTDLGLANLLPKNTDPQKAIKINYRYLAPEQLRPGPVGAAADIYSLAVIFFEMLAGGLPAERQPGEPLPPLSKFVPALDATFDHILIKASARRPADRFVGVAEMIQELETASQRWLASEVRVAEGSPGPGDDQPSPKNPAMIGPGQDIIQAKKRNLTPVLMAGGIILLGLTVLPYFIFNQPLNNPPLMAISKTAPATATSRPSPTSLSSGAPAPLATPIELTPPLLAPAEMPTLSSLPPTLTPTPPATATPPPVPTSTPSLPPTPTATPLVARVTGQIYLRWGPNREYGLAGHLSPGEEVTVLGRASNGFGLKVRKSNGQEGWITALNYLQLPLALEEITVVPVPALPRINPAGEAAPLALRQRSAFGRIPAGGDQEFEFRETQVETVFVLMFEPNVNLNKVSRVEFGIYSKNSAGVAEFVGVGSHPASDLDGDLSRGDLVWRGGPLVPNSPYFIRIINNSPETITYCLASRDVLQWTCP